jgi:hypothetical protein
MDLEAPADAWYVWFGVVLVTVAFAGVALSLPTQPAPDATEAANTIDEVAASSFNASDVYDHEATEVRVGVRTILLRNGGGTSQASIAFGSMTPVREHPDNPEPGLNITRYGYDPADEFTTPEQMAQWAATTREAARGSGSEWRKSTGELRVRRIHWGGKDVTFVVA